jgi:hypothetical protein
LGFINIRGFSLPAKGDLSCVKVSVAMTVALWRDVNIAQKLVSHEASGANVEAHFQSTTTI